MVKGSYQLKADSQLAWFREPEAGRVVQYYDGADDIASYLLEYVYVGLIKRETCVVIATPETLISLQKHLRARGVDIAGAMRDKRYVVYDAEELMADSVAPRSINQPHYRRAVNGLLPRRRAIDNRQARVFVQIVPGSQHYSRLVAFHINNTWRQLARKHGFSLYCVYQCSVSSDVSYENVNRRRLTSII